MKHYLSRGHPGERGIRVPSALLRFEGPGIDARAAGRAAAIGRQGEAENIDRFVPAPEKWAVAFVKPPKPMATRIAKAAGPVVVEGLSLIHI